MVRPLSIRFQLLALALAAVAPLLAAIIVGVLNFSNETLDSARRAVATTAARSAGDVGRFVRDIDLSLAALARRPQVRALDPAQCDPVLHDIELVFPALNFPESSNVGIRDAQGNSVCSAIPNAPSAKAVRDSPAFQEGLRAGGFHLTNALRSPVSKRWISIASYPIRREDGSVGGLLFLRLDLRDLQKQVLDSVPSPGVVAVFDRNARYLMRTLAPDTWIGRLAGNTTSMIERAKNRFTGFDTLRGSDGIVRVYAFSPVGASGWIVGAGIPQDEILAPYHARLLRGTAIGIVVLLLATLLALRISAAIAAPVHALARTAREVAGGADTLRAPVAGPAEIATVAAEFNHMLDARIAAHDSFRKVFHAAPMAMSVSRFSDGRLIEVNAAYCGLMGIPEREIVGRTAAELGFWIDSDRRALLVEQLRTAGGVREFEFRIRARSGQVLDLLLNAERIEFMGEQRVLAILSNITERKHAADLVRDLNLILEKRVAERTAELEAANRDLEGFGRTIAHDLRTPLRAIAGFTQALRESLQGSLDPVRQDYLFRVERSAARMDAMLADMLSFARSGRAPLNKVVVDMHALAKSVVEELVAGAPQPPVFEIAALPPASGDPSLLRQVWVNLVSNAIKFSSKAEHPHVQIGFSESDAAGEAGVRYFVRDNGCGFDPAFSAKLFQPFERLHSQSEFEGNGVGLAIVQRIVERHGGSVSAHSEPGKGATFGFSLPA